MAVRTLGLTEEDQEAGHHHQGDLEPRRDIRLSGSRGADPEVARGTNRVQATPGGRQENLRRGIDPDREPNMMDLS